MPSRMACPPACEARAGSCSPTAPRDDGGGPDPEADGDRVDQGHHGLGEADRGDRVGAEVGDEEDVHHGEQRLEQGLEDHRHGQQHQGALDRPLGVVLPGAPQRLAQQGPRPPRARNPRGRAVGLMGGRCARHAPAQLEWSCTMNQRPSEKRITRDVGPRATTESPRWST